MHIDCKKVFLSKSEVLGKHKKMGSGCGSVGRAVAFDTRCPRFQSSHIERLFTVNCVEKTKINKQRGREWPIFKQTPEDEIKYKKNFLSSARGKGIVLEH